MRFLTTLSRAAPFVALGVFTIAVLILRRELAQHHYAEIVGHLHSLSRGALLRALGFTVLAYAVLTRYDALAMRYVDHRISRLQVAVASFIAYSLSQTLGFAVFTGGAVRYRFWSAWGLSAPEIARAVGFAGITLWLGVVALTGGVLLFEPSVVAGITGNHPVLFAVTGTAFLLAAVSYLLLSLLQQRPLEVFGLTFTVPRPTLAVEQLVVSCLDWCLAAAVLFSVLPPIPGLGFAGFVGLFVAAQVAGLVSHVPGGLGVFDTLIVLGLGQAAGAGAVLGALVAYRAIYYLVPFALGMLLLIATEAVRQRAHLDRATRWAARWLPGVTPYALSILILGAGVLLLVSGVTPAVPSRMRWLGELLPLPVIELSHFIGSVAGMGLVILAWGLSRRLDIAYYLAMVLLTVGAVASLLKGADYEEAIFLAGSAVLLFPTRRRFFRRTRLTAEPWSTEWIVTVLLVLVAVIALGEFRYRHVVYADELWWQFALHADASRFLRATVGAFAVAAGFGVVRLLGPARATPVLPEAAELDRALAAVLEGNSAIANVALTGDKTLLWSESGKSLLAYAVSGKSWVAMGDPIGRSEDFSELAWAFRALAHQHGAWTVFYEVRKEHLPLYIDLGLTLTRIGEAARVSLSGYSLEGSHRRNLRRDFRRLEREGASFEIVPTDGVEAILPQLAVVSADWLESKRTREKGFSLGGFDPAYLRRFRHAIVRHQGRIVAFANLWETGSREELSMDLMRYTRDAPPGVMDFLFVHTFLWGAAERYRWFNLGMAPLSGFERRSLAPFRHRVGALVFEHGERFYNFQGLRQFKDKFDPIWEARYLASPGGLALPRILAGIASMISSGWKGVLGK